MWQEHEQASQRQRDWNEVDGENYEVDSRDMVPYERSSHGERPRSPKFGAYLREWRGGATGKAFGLAISRSQVQILLGATLHNNLRQVVYTYVPLSPTSITWYRQKGR